MADAISYPWLLINESYLKKYSPLPKNYNMEEVMPFVHPAEIIWVEPILGTALYDELIQQVNDNQVTELNSTLLLNIYPYLAFAVVYQALPFIQFHISEVGVTKGKSDNSDSISNKDANYMSAHLRSMLEEMKKLLKKFLDDNSEFYPKYKPEGEPCNCKCENNDYSWIYDYYDGTNKYDWEKAIVKCRLMKHRPNPNNLLYATPRQSVEIN